MLEKSPAFVYICWQIARMRSEVEKQWDEATPEVRQHYGKEYFYRCIDEDAERDACPTPEPVLDAIEDALINASPQPRYLVPGSRFLIDRFAVCYFCFTFNMFKLLI